MRHRWCAHSRGVLSRKHDQRQWDIFEPGPIILTTRTHWKEDSTPELNTLMTVRQQDVLQVRFRPESPQFSATIALDALDEQLALTPAAGLERQRRRRLDRVDRLQRRDLMAADLGRLRPRRGEQRLVDVRGPLR